MRMNNSKFYSPFWPRVPSGLRTTRLSATGPRTLLTLIATTDGGAGGIRRVYKFERSLNPSLTPSDYFFNYLGGNRADTAYYNNLFNKNRLY